MRDFRILLLVVVTVAAAFGFVLGGIPHGTPAAIETVPIHAVSAPSEDATWSHRDGGSSPSAAAVPAAPEPSQNADVTWSHGRDGSSENGEEHWRKHGGDFPEDRDADDYERSAGDFVRHPPADAEIKHRSNGDTLIYEPSTNTFAVENRDGRPRTYFKPRGGEKYWDRQH